MTLSLALSTEITLVDELTKLGEKSSMCVVVVFSTNPNELLETPTIFIAEFLNNIFLISTLFKKCI